MKVFRLVFVFVLLGFSAKSQFSISGQATFMHFLGDTKLKHFGGGAKFEYEYNSWAGLYFGFNGFSQSSYTGIVFAEAWGDETRPFVAEIPTPSVVSFLQPFIGTRVYFVGEIEADIRGGIGVYGIGELSLLVGSGTSQVSSEGYDLFYNVPITGEVKGTFYNYTAALGIGVEKPISKILLYAEAKFLARINEANSYSVTTDIPFGLSYFMGVRYPLFQY